MQEMAQMQVSYAIVVVAGEQGGHGDDILGIVVLDGSTPENPSYACAPDGGDSASG